MIFRSLDCFKRPGNDHLHCNITQGVPSLRLQFGSEISSFPITGLLKAHLGPLVLPEHAASPSLFASSFPKHLLGKRLVKDFERPSARDPMDSANCLGWGLRTAFLGPAGNTELRLCVFIGFLGSGAHDGWHGKRGESARSSDESRQTVLRPAGSGPTERLCVPQLGVGQGHPLWHSSGSEWGPGHQAVLKAQVQQLLGMLAKHAGVHFWGFKGMPHGSCWRGPLSFFSLFPEQNGRDGSKH